MAAGHGHRLWIVPDGYLPSTPEGATGPTGYFSHECICVLNDGDQAVTGTVDIYFEDRDPIKDLPFTVGAERSLHFRLDQVKDSTGQPLPRDTGYSLRLTASGPVVVQHSRLDVTQPNLALFSVMAWPLET